ncbi:hypothetical protein PVAND_000523 [Polypedilum vanderplanki]|uniref:Uncharacterized protein n=1 Tax=Polypedilum vanderplanki TaxID=319348 RepID=A0A9J6BLJ3_POLVA|nr:hypothetical protein PVAND_000523 [Polypedilum vanderplanki]
MSATRWAGRVAVVTGASAGIGAATALELCRNGIITIGLARRVEKIEELKSQLTPAQQANFHPLKCDISVEAEVIHIFNVIEKIYGGVDILVNNAGVAPTKTLLDPENSTDIQRVIDTNLLGVINCTREAVKSMRERHVEAHIILMNSIAGHYMPFQAGVPSSGIYFASKYALTALAEQYRQEFIKEKLNIKISSLSPGFVKTEIVSANTDLPQEAVEAAVENCPGLESKDIADAVIYLLSTPPNVLVTELIIRPMNEVI